LHQQVQLTLIGGRMLSFEGDGVGPSMMLDDLIETRLATLPFLETEGLPLEELLTTLEKGLPMLPASLVSAWEPLQSDLNDGTLTVPGTLRVAMMHTRGGTDGNQHAVLDLLPVARWRTCTRSGDARECFEANLRRTARLALLEATIGDVSTLSLLEAETLVEIPSRPFDGVVSVDDEYRWEGLLDSYGEHRFGPDDGSPFAFFWVDPRRGGLTAVIPDGSGGADEIIAVLQVVDHAIAIYAAASGAGPALTVVSAYGITLTRLYAAVCIALEGFVTTDLDDDVRCALERLACDALARISMPPAAKAVNRLLGVTVGAGLCDLYGAARGC
jgi:hypothetical protein